MKPFVLAPAAEGDVLILEYIEQDDPAAAVRVRDALRDAMRLLAEESHLGHVRTDLADEVLRFWPVFGREFFDEVAWERERATATAPDLHCQAGKFRRAVLRIFEKVKAFRVPQASRMSRAASH